VERERKKYIVRERERKSKGGELLRESEGDTMGHRGGVYVRGKDRRGLDKKRGQA
jgi:hypothetical protein